MVSVGRLRNVRRGALLEEAAAAVCIKERFELVDREGALLVVAPGVEAASDAAAEVVWAGFCGAGLAAPGFDAALFFSATMSATGRVQGMDGAGALVVRSLRCMAHAGACHMRGGGLFDTTPSTRRRTTTIHCPYTTND